MAATVPSRVLKPSIAVTVLLASLLSASAANAGRWWVAPGAGQQVGFHSKAPVESFDGRTDRVQGIVALDETSVGDSIAIEVRVDMASLDTGIGMRNRHMRDNHLHTDRFPEAVFRGGRVTSGAGVDLRDGEAHDLGVEGVLELHGVSRPVSLVLRATLVGIGEADVTSGLRIATEFPVSLADYDIPRPQFLFAKLGEVQRVYADLIAVEDEPPGGSGDS